MIIALAGMPGSGKTTVSRILGKKLNMPVVDTDEIIVDGHGEINGIFEHFGEEYFRNLETEAVKTACAKENAIVSTGGGCLMRRENAQYFKNHGVIVYLQTSLQTLENRLKGDTTRPLLKGGIHEKLQALAQKRAAVYSSCADYTVNTDNLTADKVADLIAELIK